MKLVFQSLLISVIIHIVILFGPMALSYYKTITYKPIEFYEGQSVYYLQNEVAFGYIGTPLGYVQLILSVVVVALIIWLVVKWYGKRVM